MDKIYLFATAPKGMEPLLAEELESLGAPSVKQTRAGVTFEGTLRLAYTTCLWSRIANRILLPLDRVFAANEHQLYEGVQAIDWQQHFTPDNTIAVDFNGRGTAIHHSKFGAQRTKDAIVDQFLDRCGSRPTVELQNPDIRINVYLYKDQATISLDLSGASLHLRGYREQQVAAPLKENLAAAILMRAGWNDIAKQGGSLVDPMCGSGTLLIEAAMMAGDHAPGLMRRHFGFVFWKRHDKTLWRQLYDAAINRRNEGTSNIPPLYGYDHDASAISIAKANITRAGLCAYIRVNRQPLSKLVNIDHGKFGLLVSNPPYGERIGDKNTLPTLYKTLGDGLKRQYKGWRAAILTGDTELGKWIGIRARRMYKLYNGALECTLLRFDVEPEWFMKRDSGQRNELTPLPAEARSNGATMFANRLRKNINHLRKWADKHGIFSYRLYDNDLPDYAFAIDLYQGKQSWIHLQEYAAPKTVEKHKAVQRRREVIGIIPELLNIDREQMFYKIRQKQKGLRQYEKSDQKPVFHSIKEGEYAFLLDFGSYLDAGLFLDHRLTRQLIAQLAKNKTVLNLFSYTGSISVYAARGGAKSVTSVDLSKTYLEWSKNNFKHNLISLDKHEFIHADCVQWLKNLNPQKKYQLIVLDPPTFSNSKSMNKPFDVQRDHNHLIRLAMRSLTTDGILIFSTNFRRFKIDESLQEDYHVVNITDQTIPKDFERNRKIHNCWQIRQR